MKEFIKKNKTYVIGLSISILLLVIDQIIKSLINKNIGLGEDKVVIDNFFYLTKSLNFGCLNGAIQDGRWLLIPITIIALGFFVYILIKTDYGKQKLFFIGMISVIGGALGNLFDRIFRAGGGVIDYLKFYFAGKGHDWFLNNLIGFSINPWPTFNFADICLTVGVIILFIAIIFFDKKEEKTKDGNN